MAVENRDDPTVYRYYDDGTVMRLGQLAETINVDEAFSNILDRNSEEANPLTFVIKSREGGEFDIKSNEKTIFMIGNQNPGTTFIFNNDEFESQDLGNFYFGAVGDAIGFSKELLSKVAGIIQLLTGTSENVGYILT